MKKFILPFIFFIILFISCKPIIITPDFVSAPENITASDITSSGLTLSWDKVNKAKRYLIYISYDNEDFYLYTLSNKNSITIDSLSPGAAYYFKIESAFSTENYVYNDNLIYSHNSKVIPVTLLFNEGYGLITPRYVYAALIQNGSSLPSVSVTWDSVTGAGYYKIYRKPADAENYTEIASNVKTTGWTDTTAAFGQEYYYAVQAMDDAGKKSELKDSEKIAVVINRNISFASAYSLTYDSPVYYQIEKEYFASVFSFTANSSGKAKFVLDSPVNLQVNLYKDNGTDQPLFIKSALYEKNLPLIFSELTESQKYYIRINDFTESNELTKLILQ